MVGVEDGTKSSLALVLVIHLVVHLMKVVEHPMVENVVDPTIELVLEPMGAYGIGWYNQ